MNALLSVSRRVGLPAAFALALLGTTDFGSAYAQGSAPLAEKDVLVFTNGDQLSGRLQNSHGGSVVFKSDMAGEITVPLDKIKELRTAGAFAVLQHHAPVAVSRQVQPGKIVLNEQEVAVTPPNGAAPSEIPIKDVAYIVDAKTFTTELSHEPSLLHGWTGTANLGTTLVQSTIHGGTVTGGVSLARKVPTVPFFRTRNRTTIDFQENYGVLTTPNFIAGTPNDVQAKTSIMHAALERDEYVSRRWFVLGTAVFDHNYAQSLDLQQIYGVGVGRTVFQTAIQQLDVKADAHYERQKFFNNVGNQNLFGSEFSDRYTRILPYKVSLVQTASYLPAWNNTHAYSANGSLALLAPLFHGLGFSVTATDSYLNNPVPGYQKNSFTLSTGLTYAFK